MIRNKVYLATIKEVICATPDYKLGSITPDKNLKMIDVGVFEVVPDGIYYRNLSTGEFYSGLKECYEVGEHVVTKIQPLTRKKAKKKCLQKSL